MELDVNVENSWLCMKRYKVPETKLEEKLMLPL